MHTTNDIANMQDTSTQAMTEVALGLAMAFFALLIIALMSVGMPSASNASTAQVNVESSSAIDVSKQVKLSINLHDATTNNTSENLSSKPDVAGREKQTILLYWAGQFFDTNQKIVDVETIQLLDDVVVAVSPEIPFNQLIDVQAKFINKKLHLTTLDAQWQSSFRGKHNATGFVEQSKVGHHGG